MAESSPSVAVAPAPMEFIDLRAQRRHLGARLDRAVARVLDHGRFVLGPEVEALEERLASFCGVRHAITCANGTDALVLVLRAWGVGPGHAVIVPAFTFAASAEAVVLAGAVPIFVDVLPDTFNLDPAGLAAALEAAPHRGVEVRAVMTVDLFGQPAAYDDVVPIARRAGLRVLADGAQGFGGSWRGRRVGSLADATTTSFFPAKPLGCYGDGGAVFTDDDETAALLRSLRVHGQGAHRYENVRVGLNSRLDTVQAAVLLEKLAIFDEELEARQRAAERYEKGLAGAVATPSVPEGATSAWAQYTVRTARRDRVAGELAAAGIPTAVHYPCTLDQQPAYAGFPVGPRGVPVARDLAGRVLSLPMHPYLDAAQQDRICDELRRAVGSP